MEPEMCLELICFPCDIVYHPGKLCIFPTFVISCAIIDDEASSLEVMLLLCILFAFGSSRSYGIQQRKHSFQPPTLNDLLDSILRLMDFFSKKFDVVNVDGIFGVRLAQGEMMRALDKGNMGEYSPAIFTAEVRRKIEKIQNLAELTSTLALPVIKNRDNKYYTMFYPTIEKPWRPFELRSKRLKKMDEKYVPTLIHVEDALFNETSSDECMGSLIGTAGKRCDVNKCWDMMTKTGVTLYYTTHQLLYFQLGLQAGCQTQFEQKMSNIGGLEDILHGLCYNIVYQMETMFKQGKVNYLFQDIFLEDGAVCGSIGIRDALNVKWLEEVMTWQDRRTGCFKEAFNDAGDWYAEEYLFGKDLEKTRLQWRKRKLLYDVEMGDSCSAHKSGVAAGFLAVHIRLFLEKDVVNYHLDRFDQQSGDREFVAEQTSAAYYFLLIIAAIAIGVILTRRPKRSGLLRAVFRV